MPATITLIGENNTDQAFDEAIASLDRLDREAQQAGVSAADLNKEMESRAATRYQQAVKAAADELEGLAEQNRRAAEETERLANKKERMEKLASGVTAVSSAFSALRDGGEIAVATFDRVYEAISRLAERGNAGMMELKGTIDSFNFSSESFLETILTANGELTATGERINTRLQETSRGWDIYIEKLFGVSRAEREATEARIQGQEALAQYEAKRAAEEKARFYSQLSDLEDVRKRIEENEKVLRLANEGKYQGGPGRLDEVRAELDMLIPREQQLAAEQKKAAEDLAAAEKRAAEEAAKLEEERHQQAIANADAEIEKRKTLQSLLSDGLNELMREEEERQQSIEEWHLKNEGREEELHSKRIQWIEEETATAVEKAETEEERIKATLEGEKRLRNELHSERMRLIELEERRQKEAEEAAKKVEADRLAQLQGAAGSGDKFNRDVAVRQVADARIQTAREEFFAEGRGEGLNQKQLDRELEILRRQEMGRTMRDASMGRLHVDELASSQQKLAQSAGRLAEAELRRSVVQAQATEAVARNNEAIEQRVDTLTRQLEGVLNMIKGQASRLGAQRRGLG